MNRSITLIFLTIISQQLFAQVSQQWQFYGDTPEESRWIVADSHDNVYSFGSNGGIRKYNHFGDTVFYITDTANSYVPYKIAIDSDDHIVTLGTFASGGGAYEIIVEKFDTSGNRIWATVAITPNGTEPFATSITFDQNKDIYITGWDGGQFFGKYYTAKITSAGTFVWGNSYLQSNSMVYYGLDIAVFNPNNIYSVGFVDENTVTTDMVIIKYNSIGDTIWTRRFGYYQYFGGQWTTNDKGTQVETDQYGNVYVLSTDISDQHEVLIKYDSLGNRLFVNQLHVLPTHIVNMIIYNNEIYLGGNVDPGGGMGLPFASKLDLNGNVIFDSTYNSLSVAITAMDRYKDGIVMTGNSYTCNGCEWNGFTMCFDGTGHGVWSHEMNTASGMFSDQPYAITTDHSGGIYVTGNGNGSSYWMDTYKLYPCDEINPTIISSGSVHTAKYISGAVYTWRDCANDSVVAHGTELNEYTQTYPGTFAVDISVGSCHDSSSCLLTNAATIQNDKLTYSIFPNPTGGKLYLNGITSKDVQCSIFSMDGREVRSVFLLEDDNTIDIQDLEPDIYMLSISEKSKSVFLKVVKS